MRAEEAGRKRETGRRKENVERRSEWKRRRPTASTREPEARWTPSCGPGRPRTLHRESWAPGEKFSQVLPHQASNAMIIVSFELGVGIADRPRGSLDSNGLCRLGPESS